MDKQRGGVFAVSGYVAVVLVILATLEAVAICHLLKHRAIEIHTSQVKISGDDEYVTHAFPAGRTVCDGFHTICWIRI